jgi:hypothetical protein
MAPMSQDGRKLKVAFDEDAEELERIVRDDLPRMIEARKHLEYVEKALKEIVEQMPLAEREAAGWAVRERHVKSIAPEGLRELHDYMGDEFYRLVGLSMTRLEDTVGRPKKGEPLAPELKIAKTWTLEEVGSSYVVPVNTGNGRG